MSSKSIVVGITHGDLNGISYEVIMKALSDNRVLDNKTIIVYGSPKAAAYHRKALEINNFNFNLISDASEANPKKPNIINCVDNTIRVDIGKSTDIAGKASIDALNAAVEDLKNGKLDVLVTCPINKDNVSQAGFEFPGHTEYLAKSFESDEHLMLMVSEQMRIGVHTGHIPLAEVTEKVTEDSVFKKIRLLSNILKKDFTIRKPRIAVLGLNPHAGDNGVIGTEDQEQVLPAIKKANEKGMVAEGPFPADGFFGSNDYKKYDAILAMYHDQGLVPFKAISFDTGVNYTAGLSVIRTSPGHGTAFSIAGQNKASERSLREAIYLAVDSFKHRTSNADLEANKLRPQQIPD